MSNCSAVTKEDAMHAIKKATNTRVEMDIAFQSRRQRIDRESQQLLRTERVLCNTVSQPLSISILKQPFINPHSASLVGSNDGSVMFPVW